MTMAGAGRLVAPAALLLALVSPAAAEGLGLTGRRQGVVLPGPELVAAPRDDRPIVLRIVGTWPHGTDTRYDLEFYGLEAGTFDLRDYLQRADGAPLEPDELPALPVVIVDPLPAGQVRPHALAPGDVPRLGGYGVLLRVAIVLWALVLVVLVSLRPKPARSTQREGPARGPALIDQLKPLVDQALEGALTPAGQAELEGLLVGYWRQRLGLQDQAGAVALARLREHPQAGALLRALEGWLYQPPGREDVDLQELLAPYRERST